MICPRCGESNEDSALICAICEKELEQWGTYQAVPGKEVCVKRTTHFMGIRRIALSLVIAFALVLMMLIFIISIQGG